jgi:hypothetical protein
MYLIGAIRCRYWPLAAFGVFYLCWAASFVWIPANLIPAVFLVGIGTLLGFRFPVIINGWPRSPTMLIVSAYGARASSPQRPRAADSLPACVRAPCQHQHIQVAVDRGGVIERSLGQEPLDQHEATLIVHRARTVHENPCGSYVFPVVDDYFEEVYVAAIRHCDKEVTKDADAADTSRVGRKLFTRTGDDARQVE